MCSSEQSSNSIQFINIDASSDCLHNPVRETKDEGMSHEKDVDEEKLIKNFIDSNENFPVTSLNGQQNASLTLIPPSLLTENLGNANLSKFAQHQSQNGIKETIRNSDSFKLLDDFEYIKTVENSENNLRHDTFHTQFSPDANTKDSNSLLDGKNPLILPSSGANELQQQIVFSGNFNKKDNHNHGLGKPSFEGANARNANVSVTKPVENAAKTLSDIKKLLKPVQVIGCVLTIGLRIRHSAINTVFLQDGLRYQTSFKFTASVCFNSNLL